MAIERTFSIIKPDATENNNVGGILQLIEKSGLRIVAMRRMHLTKAQAGGFYEVHKERPFFGELVDFMTRPEQQRPYPNLSGSSVTNLEAIKGIDADVAPLLASYPDNMKVARLIDSDFWIDNADQLTQRFNAWASR